MESGADAGVAAEVREAAEAARISARAEAAAEATRISARCQSRTSGSAGGRHVRAVVWKVVRDRTLPIFFFALRRKRGTNAESTREGEGEGRGGYRKAVLPRSPLVDPKPGRGRRDKRTIARAPCTPGHPAGNRAPRFVPTEGGFVLTGRARPRPARSGSLAGDEIACSRKRPEPGWGPGLTRPDGPPVPVVLARISMPIELGSLAPERPRADPRGSPAVGRSTGRVSALWSWVRPEVGRGGGGGEAPGDDLLGAICAPHLALVTRRVQPSPSRRAEPSTSRRAEHEPRALVLAARRVQPLFSRSAGAAMKGTRTTPRRQRRQASRERNPRA